MSRSYNNNDIRPYVLIISVFVFLNGIAQCVISYKSDKEYKALRAKRELKIAGEEAQRQAEQAQRQAEQAQRQAEQAQRELGTAQSSIDTWKDRESAYSKEQYQKALAKMKEVKSRYNKKSLAKLDEILAVTKAAVEVTTAVVHSNRSPSDAKIAASMSPEDIAFLVQRAVDLATELHTPDDKIDNIQAILSNAKAQ